MSTSSISQELLHQSLQLNEQLDRLELTITAQQTDGAADPSAMLAELSELEDLQISLNEMKRLIPMIDDLAGGALTELQIHLIQMGERLDIFLNVCRSSLRERVDLATREDSFENKLYSLYLDRTNMLEEKRREGLTLHDATTEIESVLKGRIDILFRDAHPCQKGQLIGFAKETEQLHFDYFKGEFQKIQNFFTKDPATDFNRLLPLMGSLNSFILGHTFVSDRNKDEMELLAAEIMTILDLILQSQQAMEAYSRSGSGLKSQLLNALEKKDEAALKALLPQTEQTMREAFYETLSGLLIANGELEIPPGAMELLDNGLHAMTSFASPELCQQAVNIIFPNDMEEESLAKKMDEELAAIRLSLEPAIHNDMDGDLELALSIELSEHI